MNDTSHYAVGTYLDIPQPHTITACASTIDSGGVARSIRDRPIDDKHRSGVISRITDGANFLVGSSEQYWRDDNILGAGAQLKDKARSR